MHRFVEFIASHYEVKKMPATFDASNELLRKLGYRLTPQRSMILNVLTEAKEHLNIEQITERVQQHYPNVSLSTVYRTLELLKTIGLVRESHLPGKPPSYERTADNTHH